MNENFLCPLCDQVVEKDYAIDVYVDGHKLDVCIFCGMILDMDPADLREQLQDKAFHEHYGRMVLSRSRLRAKCK